MKWLKQARRRSGILGEMLSFFWRVKMWWLIPLIVIFTLLIIIILVAGSSPIAPFIYPLI